LLTIRDSTVDWRLNSELETQQRTGNPSFSGANSSLAHSWISHLPCLYLALAALAARFFGLSSWNLEQTSRTTLPFLEELMPCHSIEDRSRE
jgi:hypothetical protein